MTARKGVRAFFSSVLLVSMATVSPFFSPCSLQAAVVEDLSIGSGNESTFAPSSAASTDALAMAMDVFDVDQMQALAEMTKMHFALKEYENALQDANSIIEKYPFISLGYLQRGYANQALGKISEAIADYSKAIEINLQYLEAYRFRGFAYVQLGKYKKAIEDFDRAIKEDTNDAGSFCIRAYCKSKLDQNEDALKDADAALRIAPQYADARHVRGEILALLNRREEAVADLAEAIRLDPEKYNRNYTNANVEGQQSGETPNKGKAESYDAKMSTAATTPLGSTKYSFASASPNAAPTPATPENSLKTDFLNTKGPMPAIRATVNVSGANDSTAPTKDAIKKKPDSEAIKKAAKQRRAEYESRLKQAHADEETQQK